MAEVDAALKYIKGSSLLDDLTLERGSYSSDFHAYARHLDYSFGVGHLRDTTPEHARSYVMHPRIVESSQVCEPTANTKYFRRTALRLLYRGARQTGAVAPGFDPTLDLELPHPSGPSTRPLTDDEIALGRSYAVRRIRETVTPVCWALAEAVSAPVEN